MSARASAGGCRAAAVLPIAVALAGCASSVVVTPMATGQVAVQAFELRGPDAQQLRQEAGRLCMGRGEVLRDSAQQRYTPTPEGRVGRWWQAAVDAVTPSDRHAQLVVVCQAQPARELVAASPPAALPVDESPGLFSSLWRRVTGKRGAAAPAAVDAAVPYGF